MRAGEVGSVTGRRSRRDRERGIGGFGRAFTVFDFIGDHAQRQHFDARNGLIPCTAVSHHAWKCLNCGEEPPVGLALDFDLQRHGPNFSS